MKVAACKPFSSIRLGNVSPGRVLDLPESQARMYLERGLAVPYEVKIIPFAPSFALPPDPVSQSPTANTSEGGKRKRGRPKKGESLS